MFEPVAHIGDRECDEFIAVKLKMLVMNLDQQIECFDVFTELGEIESRKRQSGEVVKCIHDRPANGAHDHPARDGGDRQIQEATDRGRLHRHDGEPRPKRWDKFADAPKCRRTWHEIRDQGAEVGVGHALHLSRLSIARKDKMQFVVSEFENDQLKKHLGLQRLAERGRCFHGD